MCGLRPRAVVFGLVEREPTLGLAEFQAPPRITGKDRHGNATYQGGWQNNRRSGMRPSIRFVENIREELDAPGEWFLDRKARLLYYYPPKGLDLGKAVVEGVRLRGLVAFRGTRAKPVRFVTLKGLTFRCSEVTLEVAGPTTRGNRARGGGWETVSTPRKLVHPTGK
jgi:hypothetical protein